jgi:2-phosphosulfolactate phosphatase
VKRIKADGSEREGVSARRTSTSLEVLFAPAEFSALAERDLTETTCVVFDVLRATSSMIMALENGAASILPVPNIPEALAAGAEDPEALLVGERNGVRITSELTRGADFDLGNSPREFVCDIVRGKKLVMTTTNGTRALRACARARRVLVAAMFNLSAIAGEIERSRVEKLLIVCSGTYEEASYEDALGAGALCDALWKNFESGRVADSARIARALYLVEKDDLAAGFGKGRNGRRLLSHPELREDVAFCARRDIIDWVAEMGTDGQVRKCSVGHPG